MPAGHQVLLRAAGHAELAERDPAAPRGRQSLPVAHGPPARPARGRPAPHSPGACSRGPARRHAHGAAGPGRTTWRRGGDAGLRDRGPRRGPGGGPCRLRRGGGGRPSPGRPGDGGLRVRPRPRGGGSVGGGAPSGCFVGALLRRLPRPAAHRSAPRLPGALWHVGGAAPGGLCLFPRKGPCAPGRRPGRARGPGSRRRAHRARVLHAPGTASPGHGRGRASLRAGRVPGGRRERGGGPEGGARLGQPPEPEPRACGPARAVGTR